jgi:arylsulfatase A-like enzyme
MNIFWILEDALRPAHLGCYGYDKPTSPNIDKLAAQSVRFDQCIATASHTLPPIVSMIMGQTPATHGIVNPATFTRWRQGAWQDKTTPLHILRDEGYEIDGELVTRWAALGFTRDWPGDKIDEYFERHRGVKWFFYAEPYPTHLPYNPPEDYFKLFLGDHQPSDATLERMNIVRKFLIVHPTDVISKLEAGEDDPLPDDETDEAHKRTAAGVDLKPEDKPAVHALYDGEVRVFDDMVGKWIDQLDELNLLDDTLIILTADHGEELMERGHVGHCSCNLKGTLFDESIRVPLLIRFPGGKHAGKVIDRQVSHIDIMPTLFDLLGYDRPDWMDGESMLPLIEGRTNTFRSEAFCETTPAGWQALSGDDREVFAVRTSRWKLILHTDERRSARRYELFDLQADPGETRDLYAQRTASTEVQALQSRLDDYVNRARQGRGR